MVANGERCEIAGIKVSTAASYNHLIQNIQSTNWIRLNNCLNIAHFPGIWKKKNSNFTSRTFNTRGRRLSYRFFKTFYSTKKRESIGCSVSQYCNKFEIIRIIIVEKIDLWYIHTCPMSIENSIRNLTE